MQRRLSTLAVMVAALLLASGIATAQYDNDGYDLTSEQVKSRLEAAGYTNVHDLEREGAHFDADAMKDGKAVHLHVDVRSGAITPVADEAEEEEEHESHRQP
ncbi:PepSY domain-containing protein [Lysobacter tyrosinilyticus]